jgi:hypothetical protein
MRASAQVLGNGQQVVLVIGADSSMSGHTSHPLVPGYGLRQLGTGPN